MRQVGDLVHPLSLYAVAGMVAKYIYIFIYCPKSSRSRFMASQTANKALASYRNRTTAYLGFPCHSFFILHIAVSPSIFLYIIILHINNMGLSETGWKAIFRLPP